MSLSLFLSLRQSQTLLCLCNCVLSMGSTIHTVTLQRWERLTLLLLRSVTSYLLAFHDQALLVASWNPPGNILLNIVCYNTTFYFFIANTPVLLCKSEELTYKNKASAWTQYGPKPSRMNNESSGVSVGLCSLTAHIIKENGGFLFLSVKSKCFQYVKWLLVSGICQICHFY